MRARLMSTVTSTREPEIAKRWIRPHQSIRPPNPQDQHQAEVEFSFDGQALHVTGCQPLRT